MHAGREERSERVPRLVDVGEEAGSTSHLNHEIDSAVQNTGRSFCLFGIQVSSVRLFIASKSYSGK